MLTVEEIKNKSKSVFEEYPVNKVSLFGSYATGRQTEISDVDLLVEDSDLSLLAMSSLRQKLVSILGLDIDLVNEKSISKVFRFLIKDDEVVIYEKQR